MNIKIKKKEPNNVYKSMLLGQIRNTFRHGEQEGLRVKKERHGFQGTFLTKSKKQIPFHPQYFPHFWV